VIQLAIIALIGLGSLLLTGWTKAVALKGNLLDVPNSRSSHQVPTPRGGGLAIVVMTLLSFQVGWIFDWISANVAGALAGGGIVVAVIGFLDDQSGVAARWRLLVHVLAAVWVLFWISPAYSVPIPVGDLVLGRAGAVLSAVWIIWVLNLYNFMDGIDGIAGVEAVTVSAGATALLAYSGDYDLAYITAAIGASAVGFLFWNWPPAKIFMGDVGSGYLGFLFAVLALTAHSTSNTTLWSWLILLGVFLVDASLTLLRRSLRLEPIYQAHRSHAYQQAALKFDSHMPVTIAVGIINLLWLLPLSFAASRNPAWGAIFVAVAWAPLLVLAIWLGAGNKEVKHC